MKLKLLSLAVLLFLSLWSTCYGQASQDKLYGNWTFDYESSLKRMDDEAKSNFKTMNENHQNKIRASYKGRQLILNSDNSFSQISGDGSQFSGSWDYDDQKYRLILTYSDGMIYPLVIIQNTGARLTLKPQVLDSGKPLFQEWHFIKN